MNHPIKLTSSLMCAALLLAFSGCGESNAEKMAREKERQRLDMEKQAAREHQQANKAIADIEKKIGRKAQPLDLNLPEEKKSSAAPAAPPKP
jgi:Flp pilus assembly protein TadD